MKIINGQKLKELFLSGANNLYNHYPEIDQLNVFPVPDGDTGMNMNLTLTSGAKEIQNKNDDNVYAIAKSFSKGLLMGARGNSGVITSQIFRGFGDALEGEKAIGALALAEAFVSGKEVAYKAVLRPVEGTILTVIRESSAALLDFVKASKKEVSIEKALSVLFEEAKKSLAHTPELLPILKEVGVVDSGGAGLTVVIEGMLKAAKGEFVERTDMNDAVSGASSMASLLGGANKGYAGAELSEDEEGYGYCTQFILRLGSPEEGKKPFIEKKFQNFLASHGKSLVLARDEDIVKVHVHTLYPGSMLNYAQNYGEFVSITIENMSEEHDNIAHGDVATDMEANLARGKAKENEPLKEYGLIAVSSGKGLDEMFKELGVDEIVSGGQTMNPSSGDFVEAIKRVHAKNVFILPNNSNIVMAASQACEVSDDTPVHARVIPSKTIPQGFTALLQFNQELDEKENFEAMKSALKMVQSGSVTYAIRDTDIEGVHVTKGYYMGMKDSHGIVCSVPSKQEALVSLIKNMVTPDSAIVTIYYGNDVKEEEANETLTKLEAEYPDIEIDMREGGQPVYSYLVGIE